jgi:hypothetical protein
MRSSTSRHRSLCGAGGLQRYSALWELLTRARQWWTDPARQQHVGTLSYSPTAPRLLASALVLTGQLIADAKLDEEVCRRRAPPTLVICLAAASRRAAR